MWDAGALHPVQQVRARLPARRHPRQGLPGAGAGRRAGELQSRCRSRARSHGDDATTRSRSRPRTAPAARCACRSARRKDKANPRHKALDLRPQAEVAPAQRDNYAFFLELPEVDRARVKPDVKGTQFLQPLFEFSGACAGCGETPYLKLLTQLFGDRLLIANATGCSSIYGGNLPTTPYAHERATAAARPGPTRCSRTTPSSASACGWRSIAHEARARDLLRRLAPSIGATLADELLAARPVDRGRDRGAARAGGRAAAARSRAAAIPTRRGCRWLADALVPKSVWIVGGDGWAYDIGFGGLDHVLALGRKVNVLVLDTEVYSNTGGQQSKATPLGAAAKFAAAGKATGKKDLGADGDELRPRLRRAGRLRRQGHADGEGASSRPRRYPGPSLIIAYSHCIAHGYDLAHGLDQQKLAVDSGYWPLYRFDPRRAAAGERAAASSTPARRRSRSSSSCATRRASAWSSSRTRRGARELTRQGQAAIRTRFAALEDLARPADRPAPAGAPRAPAVAEH